MLKVLGALCVICGCSGMGWHAVSRHATRIRVLQELEQGLQFLYGEITYSACDMAELMERLSGRGGCFRDFWQGIQGMLLQHRGQPFFSYWKSQMPRIQGYRHLTAEDRMLIEKIGSNLGNLDRQTQLDTIRIFQKRLEGILGQALKEFGGNARVSMVLGVTAVLFLAIFLL